MVKMAESLAAQASLVDNQEPLDHLSSEEEEDAGPSSSSPDEAKIIVDKLHGAIERIQKVFVLLPILS